MKVNLNEVYQTDSIILPNTSSNVQTIENNIALKPNSEYRLSFETDNTNNYVPELLYFDFDEQVMIIQHRIFYQMLQVIKIIIHIRSIQVIHLALAISG